MAVDLVIYPPNSRVELAIPTAYLSPALISLFSWGREPAYLFLDTLGIEGAELKQWPRRLKQIAGDRGAARRFSAPALLSRALPQRLGRFVQAVDYMGVNEQAQLDAVGFIGHEFILSEKI